MQSYYMLGTQWGQTKCYKLHIQKKGDAAKNLYSMLQCNMLCNVLRHVVYYTWFAVDVGTSSMTHGIDGIDGMM